MFTRKRFLPPKFEGDVGALVRALQSYFLSLESPDSLSIREAFGQFNHLVLKNLDVTYSASMTIDALAGNLFVIVATDGVAFTVEAPENPTQNQVIHIRIANTSGGALGAVTWDAVFKLASWTSPATGFSRTISFYYNSANWIEIGRTTADVPN